MAIPQASEGIGNLLRLSSGLKNVSGRRKILPGAQFLEDLNAVDTDVSGTAQPMPEMNIPEADMGGELPPQSYDVRANEVINPEAPPAQEAPEQESMWTKFGRALAMHSQMGRIPSPQQPPVTPEAPPVETAQVDMQEGLPPVTASQEVAQQEESPGFFGRIGQALKDYVDPEKRKQVAAENKTLMEDAQLRAQGLDPVVERQKVAQAQEAEDAAFQQRIEEAQQDPVGMPVYGASDRVAQTPELAAEFQTITGVDMNSPEMQEAVKAYEAILTGQENNLEESINLNREQIERIKQRIETNQATDADKFYIGLALLMPLILGGIFGKEVGLGALGGAAQGFANIIGGREKRVREDEEALSAANKDLSNLALKRGELDLAKLGKEAAIRKMLPADAREFIQGKKEATWTDPATGEKKTGVVIKPGLVALPEFVTSSDDLKEMVKSANELNDVKRYTEELNDLTEDVVNIASKIKDKNLLKKGLIAAIQGTLPAGSLSKLSEDIEFDGRKQNAGILLENKLGLLANQYAQAQKLGQLDRAAQAHIAKILTNPTSSLASAKDVIDQILSVRQLTQQGLIRDATNRGFAPEFIINDFGRQNRKLYEGLNKKEEEKVSSALLRE